MICEIQPSSAIGKIKAPPSKSMAHRLLIGAGLSQGKSVIKGISLSKDIEATINCLKALGSDVKISGDEAYVTGICKENSPPSPLLNCGESGSTIRFFVPITLALGKSAKLSGAASLLKRPMDVYKELSLNHGFEFAQHDTHLSLSGELRSGTYTVKGNISSQFITGLLFALPLLDGDSRIEILPPIESYSYLKLTLSALEKFGINIKEETNSFFIKGNQKYINTECEIEGDYSNAAFLDAFNYLGGHVTVDGLQKNSLQGDRVYKDFFPLLEDGMPTIDISDCPDLGPVLFALAAAKNGAIFIGTKRLKIKESDRATAMKQELSKLGINIIIEENRVIIPKSKLVNPTERIYGHNDHRIVMAMSLLLSITGGEIEGAEAVSKSYPDYFDCIKSLGIGVKTYEAD